MYDFFSSMVQILDNRLTFSAAISYFGFFQCTVCVLGFLRPISFLHIARTDNQKCFIASVALQAMGIFVCIFAKNLSNFFTK